jgi:hypothetical protein
VPDNDIFTRHVAKSWRRATRCFHDDTDVGELAPMLMRGAARCLATSGGLPSFYALVDVYWKFLAGHLEPSDAFAALRSLQASEFYNRNVQLGARTVTRLIAAPPAEMPTFEDCVQQVARGFLSELIDHNVLDPGITEIENLRRFPTLKDREERAKACRAAIKADGRLDGLATSLRNNPKCIRMRIPRTNKPAVTTEQILTYTVG